MSVVRAHRSCCPSCLRICILVVCLGKVAPFSTLAVLAFFCIAQAYVNQKKPKAGDFVTELGSVKNASLGARLWLLDWLVFACSPSVDPIGAAPWSSVHSG